MMKKNLFILSCSAALLAALSLSGCGRSDDQAAESRLETTPTASAFSAEEASSAPEESSQAGADRGTDTYGRDNSSTNGDVKVSESEAKTTALEAAGVEESEVTGLRIQLDYDDGRPEYDVEFYYDRMEYEYEIDAQNGKILSAEQSD